jgi:hypothetical protein
LGLRSSLCVIFAEIRIISGTESNGRLLTLMANINTNQHSFLGDLGAKAHAPQVTTDLSIHLTDNVHEDTIVVFGDGSVGYKLGDDRGFTVYFILEEGIKILMVGMIRHDDQEDEARFSSRGDMGLNTRVIVELDTLSESL